MKVTSIKTHKITPGKDSDLFEILDQYVDNFKNSSILVIASKIIAITQGRYKKFTETEKEEFIKAQSQRYIPKEGHKYNLYVTITNNLLTYSAGIDQSNGAGFDILWPENPSKIANEVRAYLKKRFKIKNVGVIITDMAVIPLQWGIIAGPIAYSGFKPLKILTGSPDVFGKKYQYTKVGIMNGLAAAAGVLMGEGSEQTPLGIIEDVPFVEFQNEDPTEEELKSLIIEPENDLFGPMMKTAPWQKGGQS